MSARCVFSIFKLRAKTRGCYLWSWLNRSTSEEGAKWPKENSEPVVSLEVMNVHSSIWSVWSPLITCGFQLTHQRQYTLRREFVCTASSINMVRLRLTDVGRNISIFTPTTLLLDFKFASEQKFLFKNESGLFTEVHLQANTKIQSAV